MQNYQLAICVAGVTIQLDSDMAMTVGGAFSPFVCSGEPDYTAKFRKTERLPDFPADAVYRQSYYDILATSDQCMVVCFRMNTQGDEPYAVAEFDWTENIIQVSYLPRWQAVLDTVENGFVHILWELLMLYRSRLILHAACVKTNLGGILFSGPSGIGKSTQAQLWCQVENARLINGDRTVLRRENGVWQAFGSPYAGSSRCYINESCPVRAIVMLKQAPACSIRRLDGMEAFRSIFRGVTASTWDKKSMTLACDLTEAVAAQIPVYELSCTPDAAAVRLLRQTLENEPFQKEDI